MSLIDILPKVRGSYRADADLSKTNWFGVGGAVEVLFRPQDVEDLAFFLRNKPDDTPVHVIGVGSNLLIRDGGVRGVVIKLGRGFASISASNNEVTVGAACLDYNVAQFAKDNSLTGLEFLVGIPGTIGGAVAMNAGAYLADFASVCSQVEMVDEGGIIHLLTPREIGFVYRGNTLPEGMIFTKAILQVSPGEKDSIEQKMIEISRKREETQPIRSKTSGSSFANPTGYRAWELIDQAGCRGVMVGDAIVSEKHCNFLINQGNATARDIEELGELVRQKVKANSGINLEWEIRIIGEHEKKI